MNDQTTTPAEQPVASETRTKTGQPLLWCSIVLAGLAMLCAGLAGWYTHKLSARIDDLQYSLAATDYDKDNDLLSPDVGVIQFLHRGYSITFDTLSYTPSGLEVTGTLGNGTQRTVSSINLKLSSRPFLYKSRDKIISDPFFIFTGAGEIGSGQTSIAYLAPGKTVTFTMTIPNVKQTPDGFQILASFSGERYSYY
jgi:hypothetical protein